MLCKAMLNGFEISGLSKKDFCTKLDIKEDELDRYIQGISIPPLKLIAICLIIRPIIRVQNNPSAIPLSATIKYL